MSDPEKSTELEAPAPAVPTQQVLKWQEDYDHRVEIERQKEAEKALKGRTRVNKALDTEDTVMDVLRSAAQHQAGAAMLAAAMEQKMALNAHAQWDKLAPADQKALLRLFSRSGARAAALAESVVKLERVRQKVPLRAPATAESIKADPAKGLELLEEAAEYIDRMRGLNPTKIVSDDLMAEIEQELLAEEG
jgi:hypothetical protein